MPAGIRTIWRVKGVAIGNVRLLHVLKDSGIASPRGAHCAETANPSKEPEFPETLVTLDRPVEALQRRLRAHLGRIMIRAALEDFTMRRSGAEPGS